MIRKKIISLSSTSKSFIGNSLIYFIGNTLAKLIGFLLLPLYTRVIPPSDFGYYDLSITYITVVAAALFFDLWISVMRFMYDGKNDDEKTSATKSGFILFALSSLVYIVAAIVLAFALDVRYMGLIAAYGLLANLASIFSFVARGYGKNKDFAVSGIIATSLNGLIAVALLLVFQFDFSALYIAAIVGFIAQVVYLDIRAGIVAKALRSKFDKALTKKMLIYSLPLVINTTAFWLLTGFNRIVISQELPISENGIYAIAARFALAITLITAVFNFAWQDTLFAKAAKNQLKEFYGKSSVFYIALLLIGGTLLLPVFGIAFNLITGTSYESAKPIIPLLIIASLLSAYVAFQGSMFHSIKKTNVIFHSMLIACALNVLTCALFIRQIGLNGATLATIAGLVVCIAIRAAILKRAMPHPFEPLILVLVGIIGVSSLIYFYSSPVVNAIYLVLITPLLLIIFQKIYSRYTLKGRV